MKTKEKKAEQLQGHAESIILGSSKVTRAMGISTEGITGTAASMIYLVGCNPKLPQKCVVAAGIGDAMTVSQSVRTLRQRKIMDQVEGSDRRSKNLVLTPEGKKVFGKLKKRIGEKETQFTRLTKALEPNLDTVELT